VKIPAGGKICLPGHTKIGASVMTAIHHSVQLKYQYPIKEDVQPSYGEILYDRFISLCQEGFARSPGLPDGVFFIPKLRIWVICGVPWSGRCWYTYIFNGR
jgi:hypothetical protein